MKKVTASVILLAATLASGTALADHNSKWGEGWAKMPNDIHNTRIDTLGDRDSFRDFVRHGAGAASVNRFDTAAATNRDRSRQRATGRSTSSTRQPSTGRGRGGRTRR